MSAPRHVPRYFSRGISTVHLGTAFENRSLDMLQEQLSMSLTRVGGRNDGGIDLQGWWWLPGLGNVKGPQWESPDGIIRRRIRVLAQCKAEKKKLGPHYIREMEGVLARLKLGGEEPIVGVFVSQSPFTRSAILRAFSSSLPFFLLHLPPETQEEVDETDQGSEEGAHEGLSSHIGAAVWNPALGASNGLLQGRIEVRWERSFDGLGRPGLWFKGQKLQGFIPPKLDFETSPDR